MFLGVFSLAFFALPYITGFNAQSLVQSFENYGVPQLLYIGWMILAVATTLPISAVMFAGILYFSFSIAMIYTFIGVILGAVITFYMARWLGKDYIKQEYKSKDKGKLHEINVLIQKKPLPYVVLLSFVYIFPTNLAFMIAGVTDMTLLQVVILTVLGNITTTAAVGLISLGIINSNISYLILGIIIIAIINISPIVYYWKETKEVFVHLFR